ncbi:hypothetical protein GJV85_05190 [Sulfurimonas aquatica]|uniref:HTH luxR-type domain-containing protein n=1 Tax=Sulfurimonas aquatica TaxID=2672570 RepID=A0A975AZM4_9BACT|nr:response regulator transcription factor [Sulfurimonas aquatica]QSZ41524.1 hypothetical protein GJV85_05190 [Sulfurimonas aquatica]
MSIYLLSDKKNYLEYWSTHIADAKVITLNSLANLKVSDILIVDSFLYDENLKIAAKTVVLDNEPNFEKCIYLLQHGVKAYGNVYMHQTHILSALESVKNSKVWMYPDFIGGMIGLSNKDVKDLSEEKLSVLTKREYEITQLILDGLTNKEIAIKLTISTNTIKVHTKHIYEKLDVNDRLSLYSLLR